MKRKVCEECERPETVCICDSINHFDIKTKIIILQHQSESKHPLGTAKIAELSFSNCELKVGEIFDPKEILNNEIENETYLVFPGEDSIDISQTLPGKQNPQRIKTLIILDGTWKKAKKLLFVNEWLQKLPRVSFTPNKPSIYQIRKVPKHNYLSTLESITHCLSILEEQNFDSSLEPMQKMIDIQISRMGQETFEKNYVLGTIEEFNKEELE